MADVRLERLSKHFKEIVAVDDVELHIEEGEFFSLLGPSGCGKTTTLRMIGGFEDPTEGRVFLGGSDVTSLPPFRRDVNTVFQSYALFPHMDVFDNVAYGLRRKKTSKTETNKRVKEILELVDLAGYEHRKKNELSGGQQQRVALARALVNRPKVLLLDEPLGALDLKLRKQMQLELKRIQKEVGITFIYVTHDQDEAMTMSDRLAVMNKGRMEQIEAPQAVYENPATEFVAAFLGASNLLDAEIESSASDVSKVRLSSGETIAVPTKRLPSGSGPIRIGVRPEKVNLIRRDSDEVSAANAVAATVLVSTYTGVATSYSCRTSAGALVDVYVQNSGGATEGVGVGADVWLTWTPEHTFAVSRSDTAARKGEER